MSKILNNPIPSRQLIFVDDDNIGSTLFRRKVAIIDSRVTDEGILHNRLEIGIHPVMFGWRLRIGRYADPDCWSTGYEVDLCCGPNASLISLVYTLTLSLLVKNERWILEGRSVRELFPRFTINPIYNDEVNFHNFMKSSHIDGSRQLVVITTIDLLQFNVQLRDSTLI